MPEISHFNEINESFTLSEAITEAQRCIECKTPACKEACPIGNEIPTWIHELKKGNLGNSIAVIRFLTKNELFREGLASRDEINVGEGQKVYVIGGGKGGYVITRDFPYGMTSRRGVFAGGDVANRQATVVHAMHDAKMVAQGIAKYVDAMKIIESI